MALTDGEVLSICNSELRGASESSELSNQRSDAMDRYYAEPYGDEIAGRSQVRTREVAETVEGLLPSLMRIFAEQDNLVEFVPVGPEDEEQAQQESDVISHIFWNENRGFYNLMTFCKDALLSKTGILKAWADKTNSTEREEFEGLDDIQLGQLMEDQTVQRELIEYELTEEGHNATFITERDDVKICIVPIAPEEFGIKKDARSPYIADSSFSYCRFKKTLGELVGEGYKEDFLKSLADNDDVADEERNARRNLDDEQDYGIADEWTMRTVWVSECYVRIDRNGDGLPELLKVTIAGGSNDGNGVLMDIEEIDSVPLFATPAVPVTHKFYGLSIADLVVDLQHIQTTLLRQILDNTYLANNGMTAANDEHVNIEDLLTRRPGGIVRTKGDIPWQQVLGPIPHNQLPPQTFEILERLDERQKSRTGYGDDVGALDFGALAKVNTGVAALAFDMARSKLEMLARVIAEIGLKPLFHHVHELMIKNGYKAKALRIRNEWVQVNPAHWKSRADSVVTVGVGKVSKERKIIGFEALLAQQREMVKEGAMGTLLMPHHLYNSYKGWVEAWGFEPDLFIQDPRKLPPPPPKPPDPQQQLAQAQGQALMMDGQSKLMRAQTEQQKLALEAQKAEREAYYQQAEQAMRLELERVRADAARLKSETEASGKVISLQHDAAIKEASRQTELLEVRLDHLNKTRDRDLEYFKALTTTAATGKLPESPEDIEAREAEEAAKEAARVQQEMDKQRREGERDALVTEMFQATQQALQRFEAMSNSPKDVEYDAKGLIKSIGGRPVTRDDSGRVRRIG